MRLGKLGSIEWLLLATGVFCLIQGGVLLYKYRSIDGWIPIEAQVHRTKTDWTRGGGWRGSSSRPVSYKEFGYSYQVEHEYYEGEAIIFGGDPWKGSSGSITVFYSPSNPEMSVAQRVVPWRPLAYWFWGAGMSLALFFLLLWLNTGLDHLRDLNATPGDDNPDPQA